MEQQPAGKVSGLSRRDVLRRSAIVGGGLVWATPVVQSLGGTALAATQASGGPGPSSPPGIPGAFSYVVLVVTCGGTKYTVKFNQATNGYDQSCPASLSADDDPYGVEGDYAAASSGAASGCGAFQLSYSVTPTGGLTVDLGGCTLDYWLVHNGCFLNSTQYPNSKFEDASHWDHTMFTVASVGTTITFESLC